MAKKAPKRGASDETSTISFADAFRSNIDSVVDYGKLPEPVLCSTDSDILDIILGGGLVTGKYHCFAAAAGSGKSTTAARTMINFLNKYPDGLGIYADAEQATDDERLISLGMPYVADPSDPTGKTPKRYYDKYGNAKVEWRPGFQSVSLNFTVEEGFKLLDMLINLKVNYHKESAPALIIFDSMDVMKTEKELETDNVDQALANKAKVLKFYMERYLRKLAVYNICVVLISHIGKKIQINPYEQYDGRMGALKDLTITGGKAMQFYPYSMVMFRMRNSTVIAKETAEMGIQKGFYVEANTMKSKAFPFNLTVLLVFDALKGFVHYPTAFLNMREGNWFKGSGNSRWLPEFPDDKFNGPSFFQKIQDPDFRSKVDVSWKNYLQAAYGKYTPILMKANTLQQDSTGVSSNIDINTFEGIVDTLISSNDTAEQVVAVPEAPVQEPTPEPEPEQAVEPPQEAPFINPFSFENVEETGSEQM
jgi:RecA/RadA recombinase